MPVWIWGAAPIGNITFYPHIKLYGHIHYYNITFHKVLFPFECCAVFYVFVKNKLKF